jgi:hypothetical protein
MLNSIESIRSVFGFVVVLFFLRRGDPIFLLFRQKSAISKKHQKTKSVLSVLGLLSSCAYYSLHAKGNTFVETTNVLLPRASSQLGR